MAQQPRIPQVGEDVTDLMPPIGADVTSLMHTQPGTRPEHPHARVARLALDALPSIGGAIGGAVGMAGGPLVATGTATLGGAAGRLAQTAIRRGQGQPTPEGTDLAADVAMSGGLQGGAQAVGGAAGAVMGKAAPWLMQKALKPAKSLLDEYRTTGPKIVQTLLDEGVSVTQAGVDKLQKLLTATNAEIREAVASATGAIPKERVAARALETAHKVSKQTNPTKDLQAVSETVGEFLDHPVYKGALSVPEAQAMKVGTYQQIGKKYGEVSSAGIETQKTLARGLKEEIAAEVPSIAALNAKDSELMAALDAVGRQVALAGNKDPVGFAWVASHPVTFLAALFDRTPSVKSFVARGMYDMAGRVSKVSPDLIRVAAQSIATAPVPSHESVGAPGLVSSHDATRPSAPPQTGTRGRR